MPTTYAHHRFGCDVIQQLPTEYQSLIAQNRALFDFGVHGPDLFFYHNPVIKDSVVKMGNACHKTTGTVFFSRVNRVVNASITREASLAYAIGVLCHFVLDRFCHPYIAEKELDGVTHSLIESSFDRYLMQADGKDPRRDRVTAPLHPNAVSARIISEFYPPLSVGSVLNSQRAMVAILDLIAMEPGPLRNTAEKTLLTLHHRGFADTLVRYEDVPECADSNRKLRSYYSEALRHMDIMFPEYIANLNNGTPLGPLFQHTFGED